MAGYTGYVPAGLPVVPEYKPNRPKMGFADPTKRPVSSGGSTLVRTASDIMKALGGSTGGTGGTGGAGGGGGTSTGGAGPIAQGTNVTNFVGNTEKNPTLEQNRQSWDELKQLYRDQLAETGDPSSAMATARDANAQMVKQASEGMGQRGFGGTGMLLSQRANLLGQGARDVAKAGIDFRNEGLNRKANLLGGMTGAFSGQSTAALGEAANQIAAADLAQKAWATQLQDATERDRIAKQTAASQMSALLSLLGGLI